MTYEESKIQIACIKWFDYSYPKLKLNLFSIPNGGKRSKLAGGIQKAEGMRSGVADLFLSVYGFDKKASSFSIQMGEFQKWHGLFIEMKTTKGTQKDTQKEFQKAVEAQGYKYVICRSFDEFKIIIEGYLK